MTFENPMKQQNEGGLSLAVARDAAVQRAEKAETEVARLNAEVTRLADKAASLRMICLKHGITVTD